MLTFYYTNAELIDSLYAQTAEQVITSEEEWTTRSSKRQGKLSIGSLLQVFGVSFGPEAAGEVGRERGERKVRGFPREQKLIAVWRQLHQRVRLSVLTEGARTELRLGNLLVFEGMFSISDRSNNIAILKGTINGSVISITFSKGNMPSSVYATLIDMVEGIPLSGCGVIMRVAGPEVAIRPVAFGMNFGEAIEAF